MSDNKVQVGEWVKFHDTSGAEFGHRVPEPQWGTIAELCEVDLGNGPEPGACVEWPNVVDRSGPIPLAQLTRIGN